MWTYYLPDTLHLEPLDIRRDLAAGVNIFNKTPRKICMKRSTGLARETMVGSSADITRSITRFLNADMLIPECWIHGQIGQRQCYILRSQGLVPVISLEYHCHRQVEPILSTLRSQWADKRLQTTPATQPNRYALPPLRSTGSADPQHVVLAPL